MNKKLLNIGITGTIVTAICCFSPALVALLGVLGLGYTVMYLDWILLPALVGFLVIIVVAFIRKGEGGDAIDS